MTVRSILRSDDGGRWHGRPRSPSRRRRESFGEIAGPATIPTAKACSTRRGALRGLARVCGGDEKTRRCTCGDIREVGGYDEIVPSMNPVPFPCYHHMLRSSASFDRPICRAISGWSAVSPRPDVFSRACVQERLTAQSPTPSRASRPKGVSVFIERATRMIAPESTRGVLMTTSRIWASSAARARRASGRDGLLKRLVKVVFEQQSIAPADKSGLRMSRFKRAISGPG